MFPNEKLFLLKTWKWKYYNEKLEETLKLRSLEMLAHREMENPNFSFTQECSWLYPFLALDLSSYRGVGGT